MAVITVASDGSCLKNPGGEIGWAWADDTGRWLANGYRTGTNQIAELLGLLSILHAFRKHNLHILLDSKYALNIAESWMWNWERNGWYRDKKRSQPVSNLSIVKAIHTAMVARKQAGLTTTFKWVKGHANNRLNNIADVEAQKAAKRNKARQTAYADSSGNDFSIKQRAMLEEVGYN